jgi:hypothetical protein
MKASIYMMEPAVHSFWFELQETIKHRMEDVPSYVVQKTQGLRRVLTEKIDETQVDLQAMRTFVDTRTKSGLETVTDPREHLHEKRRA